ncbi:hypothetical protein FA95DRAFT_1608494 [Auriscalpium vulgare]|uniref:Uncharacterized protein n=1 Tax=Auriscalpium vulgare TaxID=40419 RepID=A0ACB8RK43_9AGAM|nr:hypothetical protein FA95DRAFT_1608494 [Auriscalpium vulgare]
MTPLTAHSLIEHRSFNTLSSSSQSPEATRYDAVLVEEAYDTIRHRHRPRRGPCPQRARKVSGPNIRSKSAWLEKLERRLAQAKTLRSRVGDLKASFEQGAQNELKRRPWGRLKVSPPLRAFPLAEEAELPHGPDTLLDSIKACYIKLDTFWTNEVRHVTQAVKGRRLENVERDRWRIIGIALHDLVNDNAMNAPALDALQLPFRPGVVPLVKREVFQIASKLIPALQATQTALSSARGFQRESFSVLKSAHLQRLERANSNVERNTRRCLRFFESTIGYARKVVEYAGSAANQMRTARGPHERAVALLHAGPFAASIDVLTRAPDTVRKAIHEVAGKLRKGERIWGSLANADTQVYAALRAESAMTFDPSTVKQLKKMLCKINKETSVLDQLWMSCRRKFFAL